mgnify:CR=1 FL=1
MLVWYLVIILSSFYFQSHKAVSRRNTGDFNRWHSKWLKLHVSEVQHTNLNEWFMGKSDGLVNNKTHNIGKMRFIDSSM